MATAIDLFCGIGGLTHGLRKAGISVKAGFDIDSACRYPYEQNNSATFIEKDVFELTAGELHTHWGGDPRILVGCAPCQTFSTYAMGTRGAAQSDKRWRLIGEFSRLVDETRPDIVSMENVPRAAHSAAFKDFISLLTSSGYSVWFDIINCAEYGVPQNRRRLVMLASLRGEITMRRRKIKMVTVRQAIGHLPQLEHGDSCSEDPLHRASKLSPLNLRRAQESLPGGTWKDWPEELILDCHKRNSGATYRSVYGRMMYDEPAPTLTTHCLGIGNGRFIHPEQNRGLSIREASLIQSFPRNYAFVEAGTKISPKVLARLIGNAVPVRLGYWIGREILDHLQTTRR